MGGNICVCGGLTFSPLGVQPEPDGARHAKPCRGSRRLEASMVGSRGCGVRAGGVPIDNVMCVVAVERRSRSDPEGYHDVLELCRAAVGWAK